MDNLYHLNIYATVRMGPWKDCICRLVHVTKEGMITGTISSEPADEWTGGKAEDIVAQFDGKYIHQYLHLPGFVAQLVRVADS